MFMQAVKRWLGKLFAWWPWKHRLEPPYAQATRNVNPGNTQEMFWQPLPDGTEPWTGSTSIAIEHEDNEHTRRPPQLSSSQQRPDSNPQPPRENSNIPPLPASPAFDMSGGGSESIFTIQEAQHLEALRVLIRRGTVNEGFSESRMPEQYKRYGQKRFGES
jgi:hypothetical protein